MWLRGKRNGDGSGVGVGAERRGGVGGGLESTSVVLVVVSGSSLIRRLDNVAESC